MIVKDVISAYKYAGCIVVDQLCKEIPITDDNKEEIYNRFVEHVDAANGTLRIWTFDKIDQIEGLTEFDSDKWIRADPKWDCLMNAVLLRIRRELDRLYWNKYQREMESPFDNTGTTYFNDTFTVRAYYWGEDPEEETKPNFECGPVRVYWYKHEGRGNTIFTRKGFDTPETYALMLDKCLDSLRKNFGEDVE